MQEQPTYITLYSQYSHTKDWKIVKNTQMISYDRVVTKTEAETKYLGLRRAFLHYQQDRNSSKIYGLRSEF